jgi:hypothetical protein
VTKKQTKKNTDENRPSNYIIPIGIRCNLQASKASSTEYAPAEKPAGAGSVSPFQAISLSGTYESLSKPLVSL